MLVGEQPGDREDVEGKPFVGPAGRELDRGLVAAGIERDEVYITNAVKHFKFEERGKRRMHQTPKQFEIKAAARGSTLSSTCSRPRRWWRWGPRRRRRCWGRRSG